MDRKYFIHTCCRACLGYVAVTTTIQSCTSAKILTRTISADDMIIPTSDFLIKTSKGQKFRKFILVQNELLRYPICVFRQDENNYTALWMRCTHQGTELQVFGDVLQCPAHGSEFSKDGNFNNGPATKPLRSFPIIIEPHQIKISLKAI